MRRAGFRAELARGRIRASADVAHPSTVGAGTAARDPADELGMVNLHLDHGIQGQAQLGEQPVEGVGLSEIARKTIEDEALACIRGGEPLAQHAEHNRIIHQTPGVHRLLGL